MTGSASVGGYAFPSSCSVSGQFDRCIAFSPGMYVALLTQAPLVLTVLEPITEPAQLTFNDVSVASRPPYWESNRKYNINRSL